MSEQDQKDAEGKNQEDEKEKAKIVFASEMAVINSTGYCEVFIKKGE
jgi:hypothetical protein